MSVLRKKERQLELYHMMKNGDLAARDELISSVLPLAKSIACKMAPSNRESDDYVAEAYLQTVRAVDFWEPSKGAISTIVSSFVVNGIYNLRRNVYRHGIRIPVDAKNASERDPRSPTGRAARKIFDGRPALSTGQTGDGPDLFVDYRDGGVEALIRADEVRHDLGLVRPLVSEKEWALMIEVQQSGLVGAGKTRGVGRERMRQVYQGLLFRVKRRLGLRANKKESCALCGEFKGVKGRYCDGCLSKVKKNKRAAAQARERRRRKRLASLGLPLPSVPVTDRVRRKPQSWKPSSALALPSPHPDRTSA